MKVILKTFITTIVLGIVALKKNFSIFLLNYLFNQYNNVFKLYVVNTIPFIKIIKNTKYL